MRISVRFLIFMALSLTVFLLLPLHARWAQHHSAAGAKMEDALVKRLRLTDLCLVTEARYTRHPSLADRSAPFQDHPAALEHFPSGSMIRPAPHY